MISQATANVLDQARIDITETNQHLARWWTRGKSASDMDHRDQDVHSAVEALMRAVASVSIAVERLNEAAVA